MADIEITSLTGYAATTYLRVNAGATAMEMDALTKADVGLTNVDNVADTNKPVSTIQQTALDLKANIASPTFTGTVAGITKAMVGLGSVDNVADTNKPVSTAAQTALNLKLTASNNLSDLVLASTARTNLGLGSLATQSGTFSGTSSGTNTGDQTSIVGITGTTAQFNTALSDNDFATLAGIETLSNKAIAPRIVSASNYTTDTGTSLNVDSIDIFIITAQAGALLFNAPSGNPVQGQKLIIRIKDNGTARALTWNAIFRAMGTALPNTTVLSKTLYLGLMYNSTDTKWDLVCSAQEA